MQKTPPRRTTRRTTRTDGDQTRARILDVAGALFAAHGFAETTGKAIAAEAEVDLASINYHFGSRKGLYQAALAEAHRRLIKLDQLQRIAASPVPAADKLGLLIDSLLDVALGERGWMARLMSREVLSPTSNSRALLDAEIAPKLIVVQSILSEITGFSPGDPALFRCMVSVAAPCLMLVVAGEQAPAPLRMLIKGPRAELSAHLRKFALAGLQAVGPQDAA